MITFNICSTEKRKVTSEMNSSSSLGNQIRHHYLKKNKNAVQNQPVIHRI